MTATERSTDGNTPERQSRWATLLTHSLPRFLVSGAASVVIDMGLLYLLHGIWGLWLPAATFLATATSFAVNFTMNRFWSFGSTVSPVGGQMVRYLILAAVNWVITVVFVSALAWMGLFYMSAKLITVVFNAIVNYFAYRLWVFKGVAKESTPVD
ncbi:GtrA family protein [Embleya scabrispora]|uniref:GtrA family protein n=1 Tax=Embleya scabrispora TaxID=159449 RepID=UPI001374C26A|nr:GtrA family protein [Embleya scabrispora]